MSAIGATDRLLRMLGVGCGLGCLENTNTRPWRAISIQVHHWRIADGTAFLDR